MLTSVPPNLGTPRTSRTTIRLYVSRPLRKVKYLRCTHMYPRVLLRLLLSHVKPIYPLHTYLSSVPYITRHIQEGQHALISLYSVVYNLLCLEWTNCFTLPVTTCNSTSISSNTCDKKVCSSHDATLTWTTILSPFSHELSPPFHHSDKSRSHIRHQARRRLRNIHNLFTGWIRRIQSMASATAEETRYANALVLLNFLC